MKVNKIVVVFPFGTTSSIKVEGSFGARSGDFFGDFLKQFDLWGRKENPELIPRGSSTLTLEVPIGQEKVVATLLRGMADELEK